MILAFEADILANIPEIGFDVNGGLLYDVYYASSEARISRCIKDYSLH